MDLLMFVCIYFRLYIWLSWYLSFVLSVWSLKSYIVLSMKSENPENVSVHSVGLKVI